LGVIDGKRERCIFLWMDPEGRGIRNHVGADFAGEMDGNGRASGGVFGLVGPGIGCGFVDHGGGLQRDGRIVRPVQTLRPFRPMRRLQSGLLPKS